ncbi:MAG: rod shape-determining protein MreD [Actinomycetota bacterium]|nr:MAG: rod shape-determining protein MreD [Actinomycetota bacterium]
MGFACAGRQSLAVGRKLCEVAVVRRAALVAVLLVCALTLQLTVLARLPLPGATPDLLLVVIVALGMADGPGTGVVAGFAGGLLLDLVPPAAGTVGVMALVLAAVGYLAGRVSDVEDRPVLVTIGVVVVLAAGALLGRAILGSLLGDVRVLWEDIPSLALSEVVYVAVLTPFVVPFVGALVRRLDPAARV